MVLFFLRAYNDIDHIVPIIDKWLSVNDKKVQVVITDPFINFKNDYRLTYIEDKYGITPINILEFCPLPPFIKTIFKKHVTPNTSEKSAPFIGRVVRSLTWRHVVSSKDKIDVDDMLRQLMGQESKGVVVFDINVSNFYKKTIEAARRRGLKSLAFPHGLTNFQNFLTHTDNMDIRMDTSCEERTNVFDKVYFCDKHTYGKLIQQGLKSDKGKILGSARYCREWTDTFENNILPHAENLPALSEDTLKIVLFLTKEKSNVFQKEIERTIQYILQFPNVHLIVKPHTRRMIFSTDIKADNLSIDENTPSSSLVNWAHLCLFTSTSVILECLRKDKPVLYLRKAIFNKSIFEHYIHSWDIETRDQLRDWMWKFIDNKNTRTYSREDADHCLKELVDGEYPEEVLKRHIDEINACMKEEVTV